MITLREIHRLAARYCPPQARWAHLIDCDRSWGPAHEIGHALVEPRERWGSVDYGRCSPAWCHCPGDACDVAELAAMTISARLMRHAGKPELAKRERANTEGYEYLDNKRNRRRVATMLRRLHLWPVPYTAARLESALIRQGHTAIELHRRAP